MLDTLRIFPGKRNQYTPTDPLAYCCGGKDFPTMTLDMFPDFKEIHISCCFSWDRQFCEDLKYRLEPYTKVPIGLGGPAFGSFAENFTQGFYLKENIILTSRGCNNACPWCIVSKIEGSLRELNICPGNVIQDNNFLQTNKAHKNKVFDMLRTQKNICFKGGLDPELIDNHFIDNITSLGIAELWLACDTDGSLPAFKGACEKLVSAIHCPKQAWGQIDHSPLYRKTSPFALLLQRLGLAFFRLFCHSRFCFFFPFYPLNATTRRSFPAAFL